MTERAQVLYDDDCGFCRWLLAKIVRWDRDHLLEPVNLRGPQAASLLSEMDESARLSSWHLVKPGGRTLSGGSAIAPLLGYLPARRFQFLRKVAESFPQSTERLYGLVSRNRHRFGKWLGEEACAVDPREIAKRS